MKKLSLLLFILAISIPYTLAKDNQVVWNIDNLSSIGGYGVLIFGNPKIITTDNGNALEFNGNAITAPGTNAGDRIQITGNPLGTTNSEFTIEMIFKPYATTTDFAPRVFHICRPDSMSGPRVMTMEIRSTSSWTTDFYIKSVTGSGKMGTKSYPTDQWMHMAMTYKNGVMNGYVNGMLDATQTGSTYTGLPATAEVSLGGRMNNMNYFKGSIRKLIFTPIALDPSQFTLDGTTGVNDVANEDYKLFQNYPNPVCNDTEISFTLACSEQVSIKVFNNMGHEVQTLVNSFKKEGKHKVCIGKSNLSAGMYFYTMSTASGYFESKKMIIL
jgi:hypothetical protein